jgi:hypothetical protein
VRLEVEEGSNDDIDDDVVDEAVDGNEGLFFIFFRFNL